jgi:hypothetical protein
MLGAYFDDSGSWGDTKIVVVCGFLASVEQWLLFERDWNHVLHMPHFDLEHLHMKELPTGKGKFAKFQNNLTLQRDLFDRLQRVMRSRIHETFAVAIVLDDYDIVNKEVELRERYGVPSLMAARFVIGKLTKWCSEHTPETLLKVVFDQGFKPWGLLDDSVYKHFKFRLIPGVVKDTPALQASDHAAWEIHRVLSTVGYEAMADGSAKRSAYRGSLIALFERFGRGGGEDRAIPTWDIYDEAEMRSLCERNNVPRR